MRTGVGLCVLGLLCLHSLVLGQDQEAVEVPPGVLVFCDDPAVQEAVGLALDKLNEHIITGNKMALYQILTASKSENGSGSFYSVQFSSRRSDCPAENGNSWRECGYLLDGAKKATLCNATIYVTGTETVVKQVDCQMDDPVVPERAACLGCPKDIDTDSEDLKVPLSVSIAKFNSISDSTNLFVLNRVAYATRQVVAGFRYKVGFDMRKSTCPKAEHKDLSDTCVPHADDVELAHCNATVDVAPWRHEVPEANIGCSPGAHPVVQTFRRRPPGWSPLRNIQEKVPPPTLLPLVLVPPAPKEESSEEEGDAASKSSSADKSGVDKEVHPFNCPTKPWKKFSPVRHVTIPSPATTDLPVVEGGFRDADLLG
ncbi:kininogen-1 [Lampris incognitus]|uniref:kininogen-1 n=1 Tax=Lampris incognitus TaxID=2546036 RepID=UPI0024B54D04|nr:kininogen-1 [Lampris incognitus]XP_056133117.1 kininogen-1 [Lampris incognitus]